MGGEGGEGRGGGMGGNEKGGRGTLQVASLPL